MFPAGTRRHACGDKGGGGACPPGPQLELQTLLSQGSTCWSCLLCSSKGDGGVGNQEKVRIHTRGAWLSKHMQGAAEEEKDKKTQNPAI